MAEANPTPEPIEPPARLDPQQLLAKHGDWEAVARSLAYKVDEVERDNAKYRAQKRELAAQIPADDAVILTGDAKVAYEALVASLAEAGLDTADKLKAHVELAQANAAKVAESDRAAENARIAEALGNVNPDAIPAVFTDGETFEIEGEGDSRTVYVKPREGERTPFEAYVDADPRRKALKPALFTTEQAAPPTPSSYPPQRPGGRAPAPQAFDASRAAEAKRATPDYAATF